MSSKLRTSAELFDAPVVDEKAVNDPKNAEEGTEEDPKETPKEDPKETPKEDPKDAPKDDPKVSYSALKEERHKRREMSSRIKELESKIAERDGEVGEVEPPDNNKLAKAIVGLQDSLFAMSTKAILNLEDGAECLRAFDDLCVDNEALHERMMEDKDPAQFAYDHVKGAKLTEKYGTDFQSQYKAIKAEARKEVEKEIMDKMKGRGAQPKSLSGTRNLRSPCKLRYCTEAPSGVSSTAPPRA